MQLHGYVAYWTDGAGEVSILGFWAGEGGAMDACQQDVRNGEDMGAYSGPDSAPVADTERFTLEWEPSEQISGFVADCDNGQGTYAVQRV